MSHITRTRPFGLFRRALAAAGLIACVSGGAACDEATAADDTLASDAEEAKPAPETAPVDEPRKSVIAELFEGPVPDDVELDKPYTAYNVPYTMTIPSKTWRTGGNRASSYMAMRKGSAAAVFCGGGALSVKKVQTLAKRAPALGKDVVLADDAEKITMGTDNPFPARAGSGTGTFMGEAGGRLYWMEISYDDFYGGSKMPAYAHCVMVVKASANQEVHREAKAILRAFRPPKGKKLRDDFDVELFDESKK